LASRLNGRLRQRQATSGVPSALSQPKEAARKTIEFMTGFCG
jgi:hypothetical protein